MDARQEKIQELLYSLNFSYDQPDFNEIRTYAPLIINLFCHRQKIQDNKFRTLVSNLYPLCYKFEEFGNIISYCKLNFHEIRNELISLNKVIKKQVDVGDFNQVSVFLMSPITLFASKDSPKEKLLILYKEIKRLEIEIKSSPLHFIKSEYFDLNIYTEEIGNVFCIIAMKFLDCSLLDLSDMCHTMLYLKYGIVFIDKLILNIPSLIMPALKAIISYDCTNEFIHQQQVKFISKLVSVKQTMILEAIALCINQKNLPDLVINLWGQYIFDQSVDKNIKLIKLNSFLSYLLGNSQSGRPKNWLYNFIKTNLKDDSIYNNAFQSFKRQLINLMCAIYEDLIENKFQPDSLTSISLLIKLYIILKTNLADKYLEYEADTLMNLLTFRPSMDIYGSNYITISMSLIFYCPLLTNNFDYDYKLINWFKWVLDEIETSINSFSLKESVLHILLFLSNNQSNFLNDYISTKLGIKVSMRPNTYSKIKHIIINNVYSDQICIKYLSTLTITNRLSANTYGFIPVNSFIQVFKTNKFISKKLMVKPWVTEQILNASTPLHKSLIKLVEEYVQNLLFVGKINKSNDNLLTANDIMPHVICYEHNDTNNLIPQLLFIYYVLYFEDLLINNKSQHYSPLLATELDFMTILNGIPIKFILCQAIQSHKSYAPLPAMLLYHLINNHPYMCIVEDWIYQRQPIPDFSFNFGFPQTSIQHVIARNVRHDNIDWFKIMAPSMGSLNCLSDIRCLILSILTHLDDLSFCKKADDNYLPYPYLMKVFYEYWFYLNAAGVSFDLIAETIHHLSQSRGTANHDDFRHMSTLALEPLVCLKLKPYSFINPELMAVTLRISMFCLLLSATYYTKYCTKAPGPGGYASSLTAPSRGNDRDREEMVSAMILLQESALIQILLELSTPNFDGDRDYVSANALEVKFYGKEVRCLICSYLHQKFIDDPKLGRLVHFQGYPLSLIEIVASGVPSAHVCIDLVPDLVLRDTKVETKIFGIYVASYLSFYYTMPKFMDSCRLCLRVMLTLLSPPNASLMTTKQRTQFFTCVTPALYLICHAFPTLMEECLRVLIEIGRSSHFQSTLPPPKHAPNANTCLEYRENVSFAHYLDQQAKFIDHFARDQNTGEATSGSGRSHPGHSSRERFDLTKIVNRTFNRIVVDYCAL